MITLPLFPYRRKCEGGHSLGLTPLAGVTITDSSGFPTPLNTTQQEVYSTLHSLHTRARTHTSITKQPFPTRERHTPIFFVLLSLLYLIYLKKLPTTTQQRIATYNSKTTDSEHRKQEKKGYKWPRVSF